MRKAKKKLVKGTNRKETMKAIDEPKANRKKYPELKLPLPPNTFSMAYHSGGPRPSCEGFINPALDVSKSDIKPPQKGTLRILIGVPLLAVTYEFFESFLKFWTELCMFKDPRYQIGYHFLYRRPVHMAEEHLVNIARYNKCTHILLMDDDIYDVTKADLDKLLEADKDVIGGVMHASKFPHAMCVFRRYDTKKKVIDMPVDDSIYRLYEVPCVCSECGVGLSHWDMPHCPKCGAEQSNMIQRADLIPFAFTLIKMSVFDKIKYPWFHCTNNYPTDSWFADRLIEAGLQEYGHMGVRLNHAGINDQTRPFFAQMGLAKARQNQGYVPLSPEDIDKHQQLLNQKMQETEDRLRERPKFVSQNLKKRKSEDKGPMTLVTHGVIPPVK